MTVHFEVRSPNTPSHARTLAHMETLRRREPLELPPTDSRRSGARRIAFDKYGVLESFGRLVLCTSRLNLQSALLKLDVKKVPCTGSHRIGFQVNLNA